VLYFFDSSALAKRFHTEPGSGAVDAICAGSGNQVLTSRLALVELTSVAAIKVPTGAITPEQAGKFLAAVVRSSRLNEFIVQPLLELDYAHAQTLLTRHAQHHRLRTLDALHLASALRRRTRSGLDSFVTADRTLSHDAALEGFSVLLPNEN